MTISIRRADLQRDRDLLIDFLFQFLTPHSDARRFDWLYRENPSGIALAWVADDADRGSPVGVAAMFPRRLYARGDEVLGYVLGDFCIDPRFRSLGPALSLQRACFDEVDRQSPKIAYDFPSERMLAVYRRLKTGFQKDMIRLAKPLRADRKIAEKVKSPALTRGLSTVVNRILEWRDRHKSAIRAEEIARHEGTYGEEFSVLAAQVCKDYGLCVARTAEYLNWRYLAHPIRRFQILTARRGGTLLAYVIFTLEGEDARIVDLFGIQDPELFGVLVANAVESLRDQGVITVSAPVMASHRGVRLFEQLGFQARDCCPVVFYPSMMALSESQEGHSSGWFLMDGDRDS